jgi:glycosyltransferase involved in cell wall biosynthesis
MIDDASIGGGQVHLLSLAERLDRNRFEIAVACEGEGYLVDELKKRRIPVFPLSLSNRPDPRALLSTYKLLKRWRPDLVHTHGGTAGFFGRAASFLARVKAVVHTYHGIHYLHYPQSFQRWIFLRADRLLLRLTDRLICVAESDREIGLRVGVVARDRCVVIHNGIDTSLYTPRPKERTGAGRRIGTIGRLHAQKGQEFLLRALPEVLREHPDVRCEIIGEGEIRGELEDLAKSLGIQKSVDFLGERTDIPELLCSLDVFVLPSLWEGLPLVLLEAMASGIPVVATVVDGVREICRLLEDDALAARLSARGVEAVRARFDVREMIAALERLYLELLERRYR